MNDSRLSRCHRTKGSQRLKRCGHLIGLQPVYPSVVEHQSVNSVIDSENVPASFEMAETRWSGEQRKIRAQFGDRSVPYVSCPLYPRKRTCAVHQLMSALGQKRTLCPLIRSPRPLEVVSPEEW